MTTKPIPNPYAITRSTAASYSVWFRFMIGDKIRFNAVRKQCGKQDATLIARLLNENWEKKHA